MVELIFKYFNEKINLDELINGLKGINEDVNNLIENISKLDNKEEIEELLIRNKTYIKLAKKATPNETMTMITSEICVPRPPKVTQKYFDDMVLECIKQNSKEKAWRLAFSYEYYNMDFSKIEDYYIDELDGWYLSELICIVNEQLDLDNLVLKIKNTNNQEFINYILNDESIVGFLTDEQLKVLR